MGSVCPSATACGRWTRGTAISCGGARSVRKRRAWESTARFAISFLLPLLLCLVGAPKGCTYHIHRAEYTPQQHHTGGPRPRPSPLFWPARGCGTAWRFASCGPILCAQALLSLRGGAAETAGCSSDKSRQDSDASMQEAMDTGPLSAQQLAQLTALPILELLPLCKPCRSYIHTQAH